MSAPRHPSPTPETGSANGRHRPVALEVAGLIAGLTLLVALVFVAFALPGARTAARDVPIGVAGPAPVVAQVEQALAQASPGAFAVTAYPDGDALRAAVRDRDVYGGFVLAPQQPPTTVVATGGGPAVAQAVTAVGQELAARANAGSARVEDLAPLPPDDARGFGLAGAGLPVVLGGMIPALLLIRRFPSRPGVRVAAASAFALVAGFTLAAILQFWFGSIDDGFVRVGLGLSLGLAAVSLLLIGLESVLGKVGLGLGAATVVLLGNPLSGLTSAPELLPSGWGALGQLLPPGANATLLRSTAYFDGAGGGRPVLVLTCWIALGLALVAVAVLRSRTPAAAAPTPDAEVHAVPAR